MKGRNLKMILTYEQLNKEVQKQGPHLVFNETVYLCMTELPCSIQSIEVKNGFIWSKDLTTLPNNIMLKATSYIDFYNLTKIGNNVTLKTGFGIHLNSLTTMGDNVSMNAGSVIEVNTLTTMGDNVSMNAGWWIHFYTFSMGDNVSLESDCYIYFYEIVHAHNVSIKTGDGIFWRLDDYAPRNDLRKDTRKPPRMYTGLNELKLSNEGYPSYWQEKMSAKKVE
jgi:acetyltransferase-like isoleucine patch superfamily enzyme